VTALPPFIQMTLVQVLEERRIPQSGVGPEEVLDVRVFASDDRELEAAVRNGRLRQDLYFRLNVLEVRVPPLRQRQEDLASIIQAMHERIAGASDSAIPALSLEAMDLLGSHDYPGNLGELRNVLERALVLARGEQVLPEDIQFTAVASPSDTDAALLQKDGSRSVNLPERLEADEKAAIKAALEKTHWNRSAAAKMLGLSFRQLRYRIKKFGLDR
jgi:two-component system response regulator PilR (NtrC family)